LTATACLRCCSGDDALTEFAHLDRLLMISRLRRPLILVILMLLTVYAPLASAQTAPRLDIVESRPTVDAVAADTYLPIVIAVGAVAGVVGFNLLYLGLEALPGGLAYAGAATVPAEASVAMSRIYAVTSAAIGALIANHLYSK
jgi:hypothetical protein